MTTKILALTDALGNPSASFSCPAIASIRWASHR